MVSDPLLRPSHHVGREPPNSLKSGRSGTYWSLEEWKEPDSFSVPTTGVKGADILPRHSRASISGSSNQGTGCESIESGRSGVGGADRAIGESQECEG